jgi:hypothetical protein
MTVTPPEILVPSSWVIPAGLYQTADGLSACPTNALAIPMAAESCSGSRKPAANTNEEHITNMPDTVVMNTVNVLFMSIPPVISVCGAKTKTL